jgi:AcrR family transcriptional regulator
MTIDPPQLQASFARSSNEQDERMAAILVSVRDAFIEKGFDGASMQDLARAAGMSVGNFYRYFPSKSAIVTAIVGMDLREIEAEFATIATSSDPLGTLRSVLGQHIDGTCAGDCALFAEITAAALRNAEIGGIVGRLEAEIHSYLIAVFALVTGRTHEDAARRYGGHAGLVMMLVKANGMRRPTTSRGETDLNAMILQTIDRTLHDIANDAVKV